MKNIFSLAAILWATISFGQETNNKPLSALAGKTPTSDTSLKVIYVDEEKKPAATFINGRFFQNQNLTSINPNDIEDLNVVKADTLIGNVQYSGLIYIRTKKDYPLRLVTLTELKNKYTNLKGKPAIFMVDGNFINGDYDNYLVDENNLLTIIVDKLQTEKEQINFGLIKLLTKSDENIRNRNRIIIRGTEVTKN